MKKLLVLLLTILLMSTNCYAINGGVTPDKAIHYELSAKITRFLQEKLGFEWYQSLVAMVAISCLKEQIDVAVSGSKDSWSNGDIAANMAGWTEVQVMSWEF